jgi:hypothetical protein
MADLRRVRPDDVVSKRKAARKASRPPEFNIRTALVRELSSRAPRWCVSCRPAHRAGA